jgi:hypothetical protein
MSERLCPDCGEADPEKFYATGRRCKRCASNRNAARYREQQIAAGRQSLPSRITKYQNTAIWLRAKKVRMKPSEFVKAMRITV